MVNKTKEFQREASNVIELAEYRHANNKEIHRVNVRMLGLVAFCVVGVLLLTFDWSDDSRSTAFIGILLFAVVGYFNRNHTKRLDDQTEVVSREVQAKLDNNLIALRR